MTSGPRTPRCPGSHPPTCPARPRPRRRDSRRRGEPPGGGSCDTDQRGGRTRPHHLGAVHRSGQSRRAPKSARPPKRSLRCSSSPHSRCGYETTSIRCPCFSNGWNRTTDHSRVTNGSAARPSIVKQDPLAGDAVHGSTTRLRERAVLLRRLPIGAAPRQPLRPQAPAAAPSDRRLAVAFTWSHRLAPGISIDDHS